MRIVAGQYGGRKLQVPSGNDVRPTSDKVRGAIFNVLNSLGAVEGARVLDCFCGTGALGLESLSRGAQSCLFVDSAKSSLALAEANADSLGALAQCHFMLKDATRLEPQMNGSEKYDLVFLDPPYRKNLIEPVVARLLEGGWFNDSAMLVLESAREQEPVVPGSFSVHSTKIYGDTRVSFFILS
jgi:16S rRNA (guanine966-N2)-methyltransferase